MCKTALIILVFAVYSATATGLSSGGAKQQHEFALRFSCVSINGVNHAIAKSQSLVTTLLGLGQPPIFNVFADDDSSIEAHWTSVLVNQSATSWSEKGNITFGSDGKAALHFESPGMSGSIFSPNYGAITYNITGGSGLFLGATGMMVDTFIAAASNNASAPFTINAWGFFWI